MMPTKCPRCKGSGTIECPTCKGKGKVHPSPIDLGFESEWKVCPNKDCKGTGEITCPNCQGRGLIY
jgi:DnaJ-class molecular chaperone